jgi:hypothetical protein
MFLKFNKKIEKLYSDTSVAPSSPPTTPLSKEEPVAASAVVPFPAAFRASERRTH